MVRRAYDSQRTTEDTLIPSHPFTCTIAGQIASGKSNLLLHICLEKLFQKYNRICLWSPTLELDEKIEKLTQCPNICVSNQALSDAIWEEQCELSLMLEEEPPERPILPPFHGIDEEDLFTSYDSSDIQALIDHQRETIRTYGREKSDKILLIFEDAPSLQLFRQSHRDLFAKFILTIRLYNCSAIMNVQLITTIPKIIRHNLTNAMIFECNEKSQEDCYESFSANIPKARWQEIFAVLTHKQYDFMQVNLKNRKGKKIIKNLDEFVA